MEETINEKRKKCIEELSEAIERADYFLKETCEYYQWDVKELEKVAEENYIVCPFDKSHVVPEKSMHRHLELCEWKTLGYTKDCKPLPESTIPAESPFTIKFDMELQHKVLQKAKQENLKLDIGTDEKLIPQTSDRLTSDFSRDERIAMYEYVVANTLAPDLGQDISDMNKKEKKEERSTSLLELLAQERNLKRRRAKYRGVHTNKKSHIEIMREVVQQQMEMYKEYLVEKCGMLIPDEDGETSLNNIKDEKYSSSRSEFSSSNHRIRDESVDSHSSRNFSTNYREHSKHLNSDSHRSYSRDYNDRSRENYKYHSRDYRSSRHPSQYDDREYKSHSKDSSRRHDYRDKDEDDYKSRNRYEDKHYSYKHADKNESREPKEYTNKSKSFSDWDKSCDKYDNQPDSKDCKGDRSSSVDRKDDSKSKDNNKDNQHDSKDRKRDGSSSVDRKHNSKSKDNNKDNQHDSNDCKRDGSSSIDRKHNSKSKDNSNSKKDKKHENGHKKKKHKSDKEEKKHKKSKHKHKSRSRSRSREKK